MKLFEDDQRTKLQLNQTINWESTVFYHRNPQHQQMQKTQITFQNTKYQDFKWCDQKDCNAVFSAKRYSEPPKPASNKLEIARNLVKTREFQSPLRSLINDTTNVIQNLQQQFALRNLQKVVSRTQRSANQKESISFVHKVSEKLSQQSIFVDGAIQTQASRLFEKTNGLLGNPKNQKRNLKPLKIPPIKQQLTKLKDILAPWTRQEQIEPWIAQQTEIENPTIVSYQQDLTAQESLYQEITEKQQPSIELVNQPTVEIAVVDNFQVQEIVKQEISEHEEIEEADVKQEVIESTGFPQKQILRKTKIKLETPKPIIQIPQQEVSQRGVFQTLQNYFLPAKQPTWVKKMHFNAVQYLINEQNFQGTSPQSLPPQTSPKRNKPIIPPRKFRKRLYEAPEIDTQTFLLSSTIMNESPKTYKQKMSKITAENRALSSLATKNFNIDMTQRIAATSNSKGTDYHFQQEFTSLQPLIDQEIAAHFNQIRDQINSHGDNSEQNNQLEPLLF